MNGAIAHANEALVLPTASKAGPFRFAVIEPADERQELLDLAEKKANPRRFTGEPITAFGSLESAP